MNAKTKFQSRLMPAKQELAGTKIKYTDEPIGNVKIIPDFLPSPAELAFNEEGVKITLALSKKAWNSSNPKQLKIIPSTNA